MFKYLLVSSRIGLKGYAYISNIMNKAARRKDYLDYMVEDIKEFAFSVAVITQMRKEYEQMLNIGERKAFIRGYGLALKHFKMKNAIEEVKL